MQDYLKLVWHGEICPVELCAVNNQEIKRLEELRERKREKLMQRVGKEEQIVFEKYIDCVEELLLIYMEESFEFGVKYTSKFLLNALQ